MRWLLLPFRRYAEFSGRSPRREFWPFFLLIILPPTYLFGSVYFTIVEVGRNGAASIDAVADDFGFSLALFPVVVLWLLATIVPFLAVQVRRLHDQDLSGKWVLLNLVPLGGFYLLILMCFSGTRGANRFGQDPQIVPSEE